MFTLEPRPDGTFTGDYRAAAASACAEKRTVSFTRTGDVDVNSLPDPGTLPPRVISPAEAPHGRYHITRNFANGMPQQQDGPAVRTDLRTGDRCMSYFHSGSLTHRWYSAAGTGPCTSSTTKTLRAAAAKSMRK